ncbi:reverse transcriptase domain-containing protein [Tanacetum coccineum]
MPTWCHMFNSMLTRNVRVWFDKLPKESINSYEDLRPSFRENYLQQTKHIKDPVEIHHIKQRDGESTEDFMERYKAKFLEVEGAPKCIKISGFMHGMTHPELIKRLYEKIPRSKDEMYRVTMSFLQGEVAAFSHSRKKAPAPWRQPKEGKKPNFKKGFKNKQRSDRKPDRLHHQWVAKQRVTQSFSPETVISFPSLGEEDGTEGPMIIEAEIGGHFVHRIYVDGGASSEVLYEHCFVRLRPEIRSQMIPATTSLIGFSGETIWPIGQISLLVKIGDEEHSTSAWMNFMVIRSPSQHNGIIGRTGIRKIRAVPSTAHGMLKFPVKGGTVTIRSSRVIPMECAMISGPNTQHPVTSQVLEEKIKVAIRPEYPEQTIVIGSTLTEKDTKNYHIAEHRVNVREGCLPIRQKKRGQAPERNKAIQEEVEKLVDAGIMKEVHYHSWLSNPVMVKKHDGSWRMCVDFKDLNKACPQDGYPLPEIDWKVESLCGYPFKQSRRGLSLPSRDALKMYKSERKIEGLKGFLSKLVENPCRSSNLKKLHKEERFLMTQEARDSLQTYEENSFDSQSGPTRARSTTPLWKTGVSMDSTASRMVKRSLRAAHTIVVITDQPIKQLLSNSEITGRMLKWKFELEGYDIQYRPRISIKGQILADFIVERPEEESPDEPMTEPEELPEPWTLFTDGSSCIDGSGAGLILTNPEGVEFTYAMRFRFEATNNEAEYEALIAGLRIAEQMGVKNLQANVDSRLVANQVNGSYVAKESGMVQYLEKVKKLTSNFKEFSIKQVPRSENKKADALSKIASTSFAHLSKQVLVEELNEKSINEKEVLAIVEEEGHTWMTPICEYLTKEILPKDKKKARAVRRKASRYAVINGTLYKKSFLGPWLRCVGPLQANYVLREIHEGSCSMHSGPRSVVAKAIRTGYYWPTMHTDARKLIRECNDCQVHRPIPRNPQQNLTPITSPWPFYKWGIDIAGPFPEGPGKVKFLIVAIDYFTKWIEAKPVATITGNQVKKFVWDNIVCRFGLPGEIHPQTNGLVERANRSLGEGIKARLDERSKDWIGELSHVLWAHRTMIKIKHGERHHFHQHKARKQSILAGKKGQAAIQEEKSKAKMEKYYNSKVRGISFKPGDIVYRNNDASHATDGGNLDLNGKDRMKSR